MQIDRDDPVQIVSTNAVGRNPSDKEQSAKDGFAREAKQCLVCGDTALNCNFGAITCDSCKAFFRRTAVADKGLVCPFENNCKMSVRSRKHCQKCRLAKCFRVGMSLDPSHQHVRRSKKSSNQKATTRNTEDTSEKPGSGVPPAASCAITDEIPSASACQVGLVESNSSMNRSKDDVLVSVKVPASAPSNLRADEIAGKMGTLVQAMVDDQSGANAAAVGHQDRATLVFRGARLNPIPVAIIESSSSFPFYSYTRLDATAAAAAHHSLENASSTTTRPSLPPPTTTTTTKHLKQTKVDELLASFEESKIELDTTLPPLRGTGWQDITVDDLQNVVFHLYAQCIKQHRKLSAFNSLQICDQHALLSAQLPFIAKIRAVVMYNVQTEEWRIDYPGRPILRGGKCRLIADDTYNDFLKLAASYPDQYRSNYAIYTILSAIALFDPTCAKLADPQAVVRQRHFYEQLLNDYLESAFDESESCWAYTYLSAWIKCEDMSRKSYHRRFFVEYDIDRSSLSLARVKVEVPRSDTTSGSHRALFAIADK